MSPDIRKKLIAKELKSSDRATISMWRCAESGRMPPSHSITSFGIDSMDHVLAIQWCIEKEKITPGSLENVRKKGKEITKLICCKDSPFYNLIVFSTIWDV